MIEIGSFVKSKQGRDKGNIYIVKRVFDDRAELVDGNGKTLEKPKIKNKKHLENLNENCEKLALKFKKQQMVFNAEVYSAIKKFKNK